MSIITLKNLNKTYETYKKPAGLLAALKQLFHREKIYTRAVKDMTFAIEPGEFVGFLGPNGAGKTTTLKMLSGILYPTAGEVTLLGHTPWQRERAFQKQFALVMGQKNQLWWDLPAADSFLLFKEMYEIPDEVYRANLNELTTLLGITHLLEIPVRKLSLGERMKCELTGALLHQPKVLLLDEPTIGLDVVSQTNIRDFLRRYNREKKVTILLTSHYMEDVSALCDRVIVINHGQLIYDGALRELMDEYVREKIIAVTFTQPVPKGALADYGELREYTPERAVIAVAKSAARQTAAAILSELPVDDVLITEIGLDDVIRHLFLAGHTRERVV